MEKEIKSVKKKKEKPLKILFAASEVVPFAKTGGLADVAGALPKALRDMGHDVRVIMPRYSCISDEKFKIHSTGKTVKVDIALFEHIAEIKESVLHGSDVPVYLVDNFEFYHRPELYRTPYGEYWDNAERFIFFSRAVIETLKAIDFKPDIINCNDWHTGLIPVYLKTLYAWDKWFHGIKTVYSIHNIAYQGIFNKEITRTAGFTWDIFNPRELEFYDNVNFMKGGMVFSDIINTVSPKYRDEIMTPEYGYGLDGVLRERSADVYGILNGIDYSAWDPSHDKFLHAHYSIDDLSGKEQVKKSLLAEFGLKYIEGVPLIGLVSRLDDQKGLDFIAAIIDEMMRMNIQFIVLGTGEEKYHTMFNNLKSRYHEKLGVMIKFDNKIAHNIYGGADMFLMPSRFEPCGLGQLISLKYGTVPIVRETGGLADTVKTYNFKTKQGNGFSFSGYNPWDLMQAIRVAVDTYKNRTVWNRIIQNGMKQNFSWSESAVHYENLYKKAMEK